MLLEDVRKPVEMKSSLQGQLEEGILSNLLQYLALNRVSGCLQLRNARNRIGEIFFHKGNIVHVEVGKHQGIPALAILMTWRTGGFNFRVQVAAPQHSIQLALNNLLLEASRYAETLEINSAADMGAHDDQDDAYNEPALEESGIKEYIEGEEHLTAESVLVPVLGTQTQGTIELRLPTLNLYMQFDGSRSLGEIASRMGVPVENVIHVADELLEQGFIEFASSPVVSSNFVTDLAHLVTGFMESIDEESHRRRGMSAANLSNPEEEGLTADSILAPVPLAPNQATVEVGPQTITLLTQIDGSNSLGDIARKLGMDVDEAVTMAEELLDQALVEFADRSVVSIDYINDLTRLFGNFMGPVAEIFVEDAFENLGLNAERLPESALPDLIAELRVQLENDARKVAFDNHVQRLCEKYNLALPVSRPTKR